MSHQFGLAKELDSFIYISIQIEELSSAQLIKINRFIELSFENIMTESIKNIYFSLTENSFQNFQVNNNEVFFSLCKIM